MSEIQPSTNSKSSLSPRLNSFARLKQSGKMFSLQSPQGPLCISELRRMTVTRLGSQMFRGYMLNAESHLGCRSFHDVASFISVLPLFLVFFVKAVDQKMLKSNIIQMSVSHRAPFVNLSKASMMDIQRRGQRLW